eukprot:scaffold194832_cov53-Attheya_sp.AAC.2
MSTIPTRDSSSTVAATPILPKARAFSNQQASPPWHPVASRVRQIKTHPQVCVHHGLEARRWRRRQRRGEPVYSYCGRCRLGFCQPTVPVLYYSPRGGGAAPILLLADIETSDR